MTTTSLAGPKKGSRGHAGLSVIVVLIILAGALFLRLYHWDYHDLWFDELVSNLYTVQNLSQMTAPAEVSHTEVIVKRMKSDPHSFLYYWGVYYYSALFGNGKMLRVISIVFSMLSLPIFYRLAHCPKILLTN